MFRHNSKIWFVVAVGNFLLFCLFSEIIGGDAANGYTRGGKLFLGVHGHFTEVTQRCYVASLVWELATFGGLLGAWLLKRRDRNRP